MFKKKKQTFTRENHNWSEKSLEGNSGKTDIDWYIVKRQSALCIIAKQHFKHSLVGQPLFYGLQLQLHYIKVTVL
jgi:hypothetical protein